jgi:transglutaminase-like putative cysteine protease
VRFQTVARSGRVNPNLLRGVGFGSYSTLPSTVSVWLNPEALVQSRSSEVSSIVSGALPSTYRTSMKPYDTAQKLFQAVVAKLQYVETGNMPDAVTAARSGRGDCGYFSALFVAACRNAGIPARTACGMTLGENEWHVWSEFYIPNYGWIPADPSYCDALCPDGSLPLYFGTIPELNERVAVTYGFDHTVSRSKMPMLQSPAVFTTGLTRVAPVQPYCSLSEAAVNP